ncbi:MAG: YicC family protein [Gammaproteobacteria bacterium]|nr:YicC family protein [Gammaproteobacteria bacterium]
MIASMTAFGRLERSGEWGSAIWEVRSVNHRYLEMAIRLPEDLRGLEPAVRERIARRIQRGKVDCQLRHERDAGGDDSLHVNAALAKRVIAAAESLPVAGPTTLNPIDILRWPGVLQKTTADAEELAAMLLGFLDEALAALVDTRRREGAKIARILEERCAAISAISAGARDRLPGLIDAIRARYQQRASELKVELEPVRLEQEILLLTQKMDVTEELDRLDAHVEEVCRVLRQQEPVGRRLDFLMQEMNREANTYGAKAANMELNYASVDIKVLIEQMREQVQNVE